MPLACHSVPGRPGRRRFVASGAALLGALAAGGVRAQAARPLRLVVAGPAGGSADAVARLLAEPLGQALGRAVIVEPKPGAAGVLAVQALRQAPADGDTLMVAVNSLVSEVPHALKLPLDMAQAIRPVAELARGGLVLVGRPDLPPSTLAELLAYARARPGQLDVASYSPGTMSHVLGLLLNRAAGIELVHVGYKGSTPALADVMGGHVALMFDGLATSLPLLRGGRLKAYALSLPERSPLLPSVPTFAELGYPQLTAVGWLGLWSLPGLAPAPRDRLLEAVRAALADPALRTRLADLGFEPGGARSPAQLQAQLETESARVAAVLRSIGFKPEE